MSPKEQLVVLVPDGAYPLVLSAFLDQRRPSLRIRKVSYKIVKDMFRDSSREAVELLRPFQRQCSHALVIRDFGISRSNALYGRLAAVESLKGCSVLSFNRVIGILRGWFPETC